MNVSLGREWCPATVDTGVGLSSAERLALRIRMLRRPGTMLVNGVEHDLDDAPPTAARR